MNEKIDLTNDQFDIAEYGLTGEDIYNIAKFGKKSVNFATRMRARTFLVKVMNNENPSNETARVFFFTMLSRLLWPDKEMGDNGERLVRIIDEAIEEHGIFKLEEDYIAFLKKAKEGSEN